MEIEKKLHDGIVLRRFDPPRDAAVVSRIVGDIWHGGSASLMEERFGPVGGQPWQHWMAEAVLADFASPRWQPFVAEDPEGQVVGFCSYALDQARLRGTVGYNGVAAACQGRGLGAAMLAFVLERIREAGMTYAEVIVQNNDAHAPARRIYEKQGFQPLAGFHVLVQKL